MIPPVPGLWLGRMQSKALPQSSPWFRSLTRPFPMHWRTSAITGKLCSLFERLITEQPDNLLSRMKNTFCRTLRSKEEIMRKCRKRLCSDNPGVWTRSWIIQELQEFVSFLLSEWIGSCSVDPALISPISWEYPMGWDSSHEDLGLRLLGQSS